MQKPLSNKLVNSQPPTTSAVQVTIKPADTKQSSTFVIPPPLRNSISTIEKTTSDLEIITKSVTLPINTPAQTALLADKTFENHLRTYFHKTYNVKMNIELITGNSGSRIFKIVGRQSTVDRTIEELLTLLSLFRTKTFDETTDNGWIKISDAARVIQHQLTFCNSKCVCQHQTFPISIIVHYVDKEHAELGISEQLIETLCRKKLTLTTCIHVSSTRLEKEWMTLITKIPHRAYYGKNICLFSEYPTIILFGLPQVVKDLQQQFEAINAKLENPVPITKSQMDCYPMFVENEPKKLPIEKQYNLIIPNPSKLNELATYRERTQIDTAHFPETPRTYQITFSIDEPGFEVLITQDSSRLLAIVGSKCSLQKQIINQQIQVQIPKAKITELADDTVDVQSQENNSEPPYKSNQASTNTKKHWFLELFQRKTDTQLSQSVQRKSPPSQVKSPSSPNNGTSVSVGQSKIIVCTGDLTKQAVDIIVLCSTSKILCQKIISAAGLQVETVYKQQSSCSTPAFETGGGNLLCKQIIFRLWTSEKSQLHNLKQSIDIFVSSAITYTLRCNFTTLAFPSIGCGQLGHDPKLIAEHMIGETYRQLKISHQSQLIVSFVLLPEQQNVFDAFTDRLNTIKSVNDIPVSVPFDKQTVKITLTGSNNNELIECQNKIKEFARSSSLKLHLTDKTDMADWPQNIIEKYYDYCLQRRVVPTLDIQNYILDLEGPKDAVLETEKYFFQLTAEALRHARIQYVSRGFIWLFEVSPGKWDQYASRLNDQIEDAQFKKLPHIEFTNEKSERCRVTFSRMEEEYQKRKRAVCRKRIDSSLPANWDSSSGNFKRVILQDTSKEYKDVFDQFNATMRDQRSKIVKIERIQNERWFKQYDAHRDEFQQRYKHTTERLLFHGCANASADKIVQECFNRAFAGVHGVLYGCGVYFHAQAKYSHSYTRPNVSGERTMFLARVLIGKSCVGTSAMKVPPQGFDTTTDGEHIFVIYHDAGAYGEYLITYQ